MEQKRETLTFLFSDVEGSTRLLEQHGPAMGSALARHHRLFEQLVERHRGSIFETVGDAVYAAFPAATDAATAAIDAHRELAVEDWGPIGRLCVRIAIHSGEVERRGDHFFGPALFRVARLQALAHGEQTLVSAVTARLLSAGLPANASLRDLGIHRLKDLGEPEHVYQLLHPELRAAFPALRSLGARPNNLPRQLSSFIGRDGEMAELVRLLDEHHLVTLVGPGGIGKTRLALQVAAERLERHPGGAFFVDLAPLQDAASVVAVIAETLGLQGRASEPIEDRLAAHLRETDPLLVLDNLEQLLPAAASSIAGLLAEAADLRVLATSRAALRIRGEREYAIPPLPTRMAASSVTGPSPAASLFIDRARAVDRDLPVDAANLALVADICERLDGLPLAIELAAARVRLFTLQALHDRLGRRLDVLSGGPSDVPPRQQTLRATIGWSVDLLSPAEARLFCSLGVFAGGFTMEAAEAIADPQAGATVVDGLERLLGHNLVHRVDFDGLEPRYGMLETIREYALGALTDTDAAGLRKRHLTYFLDLSERMGAADDDGEGRLKWAEQEIHNLRSAMRTADELSDGEVILRFMVATYESWFEGASRLSEAADWMERGLANAPEAGTLRADAMWRYAFVIDGLGDVPRAVILAREASLLAVTHADDHIAARALGALGVFHSRLGQPSEAVAVLEQGLSRAEAAGDREIQRRILFQIAEVRGEERIELAAGPISRAATLARQDGDTRSLADALANEGYLHLVGGDPDVARPLFEEALAAFTEWPGREDRAFTLLCLSHALAHDERERDSAMGRLNEALAALEGLDDPIGMQFFSLLVAACVARLGEAEEAARLLGAADAAATSNGVPFQRLEQVLRLRVLRLASGALTKAAIRHAAAAGCAAGTAASIAHARTTRLRGP